MLFDPNVMWKEETITLTLNGSIKTDERKSIIGLDIPKSEFIR